MNKKQFYTKEIIKTIEEIQKTRNGYILERLERILETYFKELEKLD